MTSPKLSFDALHRHDERRQVVAESPKSRRVVAYTMAGEQCCLLGLGPDLTFPANWTVRSALTVGLWVRRAREGEDATHAHNCVLLDFEPQAIIHSIGIEAMDEEFIGMYGEIVTVLAGFEPRERPLPRPSLWLPPTAAGQGSSSTASPPPTPPTPPPGAWHADYDAAASEQEKTLA